MTAETPEQSAQAQAAPPTRDAAVDVRILRRLADFRLDVAFRAGRETVVVFGPSGGGKSMTLKAIAGIIRPDAGRIAVGGHVLYDSEQTINVPPHRRRVGYVPQGYALFPHLTVAENIMAILETRTHLSEAQRQRRLENLMREFHISHLRDNLGMSLSGGEQRRVEIARALATEPRFLLLDEPFAGIDPISINDIQRITRYLSQHGIGILLTDHNVRETLGICDRAYIVNDGRIIAEGTPDVILENKQVREVYLGDQFTL